MKIAALGEKPNAGNPHVRFDGEVASEKPRRGSLLYKSFPFRKFVVTLAAVAAGLGVWAEDALPYDAELLYLQSSGGSGYVDTEYDPIPATTRFEIKASFQANTGTLAPFGVRTWNGDTESMIIFADVGKWRMDWTYSSMGSYSDAIELNHVYEMTFEGKTATIDSKTYGGTTAKGTSRLGNTFYLFNMNNRGSPWGSNGGQNMMLYSAKLYDDGVLVRDLIPVITNGVGVLYDKVGKRFYGYKGSGKLTPGPLARPSETLRISGLPLAEGPVIPAYGLHSGYTVGETYMLQAPGLFISEDGLIRSRLTGYEIVADGKTIDSKTLEGDGIHTIEYVQPENEGGVEFIWKWAHEVGVRVTAGDGGQVEPAETAYVTSGSQIVISAKPAAGKEFAKWTGDVASGVEYCPMLKLTVGTDPISVAAEFRDAGTVETDYTKIDAFVEYLESSGLKFCIDTGVNPIPATTRLDIRFCPTAQAAAFPFGVRIYGQSAEAMNLYTPGGDSPKWRMDWTYSSGAQSASVPFKWGSVCEMSLAGRAAVIDGVPYQGSEAKQTTPLGKNFYLFGMNNNGSANASRMAMKLYSAKLYDAGTLVRDFVPAVKDGVGVLYDRVEGKVYPNDEAGVFKYGLPVQTPDEVRVSGDPEQFGTVVPAYGVRSGFEIGKGYTFTGPEKVVSQDGTSQAVLSGYRVVVDGMVVKNGVFHGDGERSVGYVHRACERTVEFVWLWDKNVRMSMSAGAGGTVSPTGDGFALCGGAVDVSATPAAGKRFLRWTGDVPEGQEYRQSFTLPIGEVPLSLAAEFCDASEGVIEVTDATGLAAAVGSAEEGNVVLLKKGTYDLSETLSVNKKIVIRGESGDPADVVLDAGKKGRVITMTAPAVVECVTVRNGSQSGQPSYGAGVHMTAGTLWKCVVTSCSFASGRDQYGAGISMDGKGTLVEDCEVTGCSCASSCMNFYGGLYNKNGTVRRVSVHDTTTTADIRYYTLGACVEGADALVERCTFTRLRVKNGIIKDCTAGAAILLNGGLVRHCLISDCMLNESINYPGDGPATAAGVAVTGGTLLNCTVISNTTDSLHGGVYASGGKIENCIIWDNVGKDGIANWQGAKGSDSFFTYCCTTPALSDERSIAVDPTFRHPELSDGRLKSSSPCAKTGLYDTTYLSATTLDLYGQPLVDSKGRVPMGCVRCDPTGLILFFQ